MKLDGTTSRKENRKMENISPLNYVNWPLRYTMSTSEGADGQSLLFKVHPEVFDGFQRIGENTLNIRAGLTKFYTFSNGKDGFFGFDQSLSVNMGSDGWATLKMLFPSRQVGDDSDYRPKLSARSYSLSIFASLTYWLAKPTRETAKQLLAIESVDIGEGFGHSGISVAMSPFLVEKLKGLNNGDLESIKETMFTTDKALSPHSLKGSSGGGLAENLENFKRQEFRVILQKSDDVFYLHLSVFGISCGLDPDNLYSRDNVGYRLVPHNVDNRIQQFSLIAGLARLCEIIDSKRP